LLKEDKIDAEKHKNYKTKQQANRDEKDKMSKKKRKREPSLEEGSVKVVVLSHNNTPNKQKTAAAQDFLSQRLFSNSTIKRAFTTKHIQPNERFTKNP